MTKENANFMIQLRELERSVCKSNEDGCCTNCPYEHKPICPTDKYLYPQDVIENIAWIDCVIDNEDPSVIAEAAQHKRTRSVVSKVYELGENANNQSLIAAQVAGTRWILSNGYIFDSSSYDPMTGRLTFNAFANH